MSDGSPSIQTLVNALIDKYPEDVDDLLDALASLQKQKLGTCQRLSRMSEHHWQRLGLPLGIESLIREELSVVQGSAADSTESSAAREHAVGSHTAGSAPSRSFAADSVVRPELVSETHKHKTSAADVATLPQCTPAPAASIELVSVVADDDGQVPLEPHEFSVEGLHHRRGDRSGSSLRRGAVSSSDDKEAQPNVCMDPVELIPPGDLEQLWQQLLEDTLPPDKRPALQDSWHATSNDHDRYMMFLEYSSYLRKPEVDEDEQIERKKQLEPLMRELGIREEEEGELQETLVAWLIVGVVVIGFGWMYYAYSRPTPLHDVQAL
jgi:hypothetical protein|eukprot:TRINITY_DN43742_c0_g1_i1.p1 TRINITY_DN43742_c0_g1~~TRINITY_DN43742_c0_g1_i1.p1  ORF type:complete len:323 (-),score=56.90 TRINITY_DN43742_c0_g1_i1:171-1139(-)